VTMWFLEVVAISMMIMMTTNDGTGRWTMMITHKDHDHVDNSHPENHAS
jgi:hypothetical protein